MRRDPVPPESVHRAAARVSTRPQPASYVAHHGVWAPGVRLFRNLGFNAKATLISITFLVPLALLAFFHGSERLAAWRFTQLEREGVVYAQAVVQAIDAAGRERTVALADGPAKAQLAAVDGSAPSLARQLQVIDRIQQPLGTGWARPRRTSNC